MKTKLVTRFLVFGIVLLGCQVTTYKDQYGNVILPPSGTCPTTEARWNELGFENGYCDALDDFIDKQGLNTHYGKACAEKRLAVDYASFKLGLSEVRRFYCSTAGAYWLGYSGREFHINRCPEMNFFEALDSYDAHENGREKTKTMARLNDIYDDYGGCWYRLSDNRCYRELDLKSKDRKEAKRLTRKLQKPRGFSAPKRRCSSKPWHRKST